MNKTCIACKNLRIQPSSMLDDECAAICGLHGKLAGEDGMILAFLSTAKSCSDFELSEMAIAEGWK